MDNTVVYKFKIVRQVIEENGNNLQIILYFYMLLYYIYDYL